MKPFNQRITLLSGAAFLALSPFASAVIVYSNDFESDTIDTEPSDAEINYTGHNSGHALVRAADTNFTTQYLEIAARGQNGNFSFSFFDGALGTPAGPGYQPVTTISFDGRFNTADFVGLAAARLRLRSRDVDGGGDVTRADITQAEPIADAINSYSYIINNSDSSAAAPLVGGSIAANTYEIYENGSLLESGNTFTAAVGAGSPVDFLTLWLQGDSTTSDPPGNGDQSFVRIDNFEVHVNPVPEPSSAALLGLGALSVLLRRRR